MQRLKKYIRFKRTITRTNYKEVEFQCDITTNTLDTPTTCNICPKSGCHIHTTALDLEMIINGEKDLPGADYMISL